MENPFKREDSADKGGGAGQDDAPKPVRTSGGAGRGGGVDADKTGLADPDYSLKRLYKKGANLMADERLEDAVEVFEQALRIDPHSVETLLKLGYARFHLDDHSEALRIYDRILDIDVTNAEAWNLKGLVHYEQKNFAKALDSVEKAIESDPTYDMAWYNKACFLSLLNQIPEAIDALKRSIEIDVKNARDAVKDRDFVNMRVEDGFKRIVEVVVLESVRQGYHTIGAIVWTTFLDRVDAEDALTKLKEKGLIVQNEKRDGFQRIPVYDLSPEIAKKVGGSKRRTGLLGLVKRTSRGIGGGDGAYQVASADSLKNLVGAIQSAKTAIEAGDASKVVAEFDAFVNPSRSGRQMIDQFFEEHREIRLWRIRLEDRGNEYLQENAQRMTTMFDNIEMAVTKKLRGMARQ